MLNTKTLNNAAIEGFNKEPKTMPNDIQQSYAFSKAEIDIMDQILQRLYESPILIDQSMQITPPLDNLEKLAKQFEKLNEEKKTCANLTSRDLTHLFLFMNYTEDELNLGDAIDLGQEDYYEKLEILTDKLYKLAHYLPQHPYTFSKSEINLTDQILQRLIKDPILIDQSMQMTAPLEKLEKLGKQFSLLNEENQSCVSLTDEDLLNLFSFLYYTEEELNLGASIDLGEDDYYTTLENLTDKLYEWENKTRNNTPPSPSPNI